jgi:hypothetical protein
MVESHEFNQEDGPVHRWQLSFDHGLVMYHKIRTLDVHSLCSNYA